MSKSTQILANALRAKHANNMKYLHDWQFSIKGKLKKKKNPKNSECRYVSMEQLSYSCDWVRWWFYFQILFSDILPDQISVACIRWKEELVSSKYFHIFECLRSFVLYTFYFFSINRDRVKNLKYLKYFLISRLFSYLVIFQCLLNSNTVPVVQLHWFKIAKLPPPIDNIYKTQESSFAVEKYAGNWRPNNISPKIFQF